MKRVPLRPISPKQQARQVLWNEITKEKCQRLDSVCEWCGKRGHRDKGRYEDWDYLDGHHKVKRSRGRRDTESNAYICHRKCHGFIHEYNIDVSVYYNKTAWDMRNVT